MRLERGLLCVLMPPLAVVDYGLNAVIIVAFFTVFAWIPGVAVAFGIVGYELYQQRQAQERAATQQALAQDVSANVPLVNLPNVYRSGAERHALAVRAEQLQAEQNPQSPQRRKSS